MLDETYFGGEPGGPRYLTLAAFGALDAGELTDEDRALMLAHLENCRSCMADYLDRLAGGELLDPPEDLADRIADAVQKEWQEAQAVKHRKKTRVIQITKLAVAVCLTMVVSLGSVRLMGAMQSRNFVEYQPLPISQQQEPQPQKSQGNRFADFMQGIRQGFSQFADTINFGFNFGGDGNK